jgi:DNA-binding protein HU-beta
LKKGGISSRFWSWSVSARAARDGRNPQTGKLYKLLQKM